MNRNAEIRGDYERAPRNQSMCLTEEPLEALCAKRVMVVNGVVLYSVGNLGAILRSGNHVLTKVKIRWRWVGDQVDAHLGELDDLSRIMDHDVLVGSATVALTREFPLERTYGSKAKGLKAATPTTCRGAGRR